MEHISQVIKRVNQQESKLLVEDVTLQVDKSDWQFKSGVPLRYQNKSLINFKVNKGNQTAYKKCVDYLDKFPLKLPVRYYSLGLFSKGIWGVGKTHLVCAIANELIKRSVNICPALYITEQDMLRRIRRTYNNNNFETESDVLKKLWNIPLLIIDDVGKEEVADARFVQRIWFSIVNERYNNYRPIIITANLNPDDICYYLGGDKDNEATFDRLYEMVKGVFYEINSTKSYRRAMK